MTTGKTPLIRPFIMGHVHGEDEGPPYVDLRIRAEIDELDLEEIRDELVRRKVFYTDHADAAVGEYRRFLLLHAAGMRSDGDGCARFVPPDEVSEVWHAHILDLKRYLEDCGRIFGQTLYHGYRPSPGTDEYSHGIDIFRFLYRERYGDIPPRFTFRCEPMDREDFKVLHRRELEAGPRGRWPDRRGRSGR